MSVRAYFSSIYQVVRSIAIGMGVTLKYFLHYKRNCNTIQYPRERDLIPPRHRGIHYLETEKCVMCWKCAEICPVSCIYIEGLRGADGPLKGGFRGQKATLTKFVVDYTVCIFCGLCEEACPPQCLHLGKEYDYHSGDRRMMEKNLLTDEVYTEEDERFVRWAREEAERVKTEKKRKAEEEKARAAAAKAAAGQSPASPPPTTGVKAPDEGEKKA